MSRYVTVAVTAANLDELFGALRALGLEPQYQSGEQVMLDGTLECAGEPVDLRVAPGPFDTVEDFGFVVADGGVALVCGDVDRRRLERGLVPALSAEVAQARAVASAKASGAQVELVREADGTRRIKITRG